MLSAEELRKIADEFLLKQKEEEERIKKTALYKYIEKLKKRWIKEIEQLCLSSAKEGKYKCKFTLYDETLVWNSKEFYNIEQYLLEYFKDLKPSMVYIEPDYQDDLAFRAIEFSW